MYTVSILFETYRIFSLHSFNFSCRAYEAVVQCTGSCSEALPQASTSQLPRSPEKRTRYGHMTVM